MRAFSAFLVGLATWLVLDQLVRRPLLVNVPEATSLQTELGRGSGDKPEVGVAYTVAGHAWDDGPYAVCIVQGSEIEVWVPFHSVWSLPQGLSFKFEPPGPPNDRSRVTILDDQVL